MEEYLELIKQHEDGTMLCSFAHHMRSSSPTYNQIIAEGERIVPAVLTYLRDNEQSGMSVMLLLGDILHMSPYNPEVVTNDSGEAIPGWGGFKVGEARQAWIDWGIQEQLITV